MPASANVRMALGHHHGFHITCKIVLGEAGQHFDTQLKAACAETSKRLLLSQRCLHVSLLAQETLFTGSLVDKP